jgi:hypothetical protein
LLARGISTLSKIGAGSAGSEAFIEGAQPVDSAGTTRSSTNTPKRHAEFFAGGFDHLGATIAAKSNK